MIFAPEMVEAILAGRKTVTRRRRVDGVPCRYLNGREYAVQPGRGRKGVARLCVVSVRAGVAGDVDDAEALLEGFSCAASFADYWAMLYGSFDPLQPVWRIEFRIAHARVGWRNGIAC